MPLRLNALTRGPLDCISRMQSSVEQFIEHSKKHTVIPVWKELVADLVTPVAAFERIVGNSSGFLLESVEQGERWSRWSFVGRNPLLTIKKRNGELIVDGDIPISIGNDGQILEFVRSLQKNLSAPQIEGFPPMYSGLLGYLGYDTVREIEDLPVVPDDDLAVPDAILSVIGEVAVFDHWSQRVFLIANAIVNPESKESEILEAYQEAQERLQSLMLDGAKPLSEPLLEPPNMLAGSIDITSTMSESEYCEIVNKAKEYILAGDIFQVVLSQRFDFELEAEPFDVYRVLRQINPSPYMYFVRNEEVTLIGCSPEPLIQLRNDVVTSRPIAGTRKRGSTQAEDLALADDLLEDPKELAEHIMLVDLARNDLGKISNYGSLQVDELKTLERFSHVMHLTSQVSGKLLPGSEPIDVIKAAFPAGTVSGAPKVRAMQIIDELEKTKRGPYAGIVGYLDFNGNLDNAIAIRTMVITGSGASVQAGAGIVVDSDPLSEYKECWAKAKALIAAVKPAEEMTKTRNNGTN